MNHPMTDLEYVVRAYMTGDELPASFDLVTVLRRADLKQLGRLTASYMLRINIARLYAKQATILASLPKPPCH